MKAEGISFGVVSYAQFSALGEHFSERRISAMDVTQLVHGHTLCTLFY